MMIRATKNFKTSEEYFEIISTRFYWLLNFIGINVASPTFKRNGLFVFGASLASFHMMCTVYTLVFMGQSTSMVLQSASVAGYGFFVSTLLF